MFDEAAANYIAHKGDITEHLAFFFGDVEDFIDNIAEAYPDDAPRPWGDTDPTLWALGFYFDPERAKEVDEWDLMEGTETGPLDILRTLEGMGETTDRMSKNPNDPPGLMIRELNDPESVWEGLRRAAEALMEEKVR